MSSTFSFVDVDYSVSNARFGNLLRWALICSADVQHDNKDLFVSKMRSLIEDLFIPIGMLNFHEHFNIDELKFWSDVFFRLGVEIYEGNVGNQSNREWQPTAIADAIQISRLLKDLAWNMKEGIVN